VTVGDQDAHEPFCANNNVTTAFIFVAGSALILVGCVNGVKHGNRTDSSAFSLFFQACYLFVIARLFIGFGCARERIVLAVAAISGLLDLIFGLAPVKSRPFVGPFRFVDLGLWLLAFAVSFTMLVSAFRKQKAMRAARPS
jgi:uncharacterized membrane protein YvlD (DUF360 family)